MKKNKRYESKSDKGDFDQLKESFVLGMDYTIYLKKRGVHSVSKRGLERPVRCNSCGKAFGFTSGKPDAVPMLETCAPCRQRGNA